MSIDCSVFNLNNEKIYIFKFSVTVYNNIKFSFYRVLRRIYRQFSDEFKLFSESTSDNVNYV